MLSTLRDRAVNWHVTAAERVADYPCDGLAGPEPMRALRAVDIDAPAALAFRWVCQLKVAPYSYDWLDNRGRRSPRTLTPGADDLALGQPFMPFTIREFVVGEHITAAIPPRSQRLFGPLAVTYQVRSRSGDLDRCRLVTCLAISARGWRAPLRELLILGDLVMMTKQLRTLKACAEATAAQSVMEDRR